METNRSLQSDRDWVAVAASSIGLMFSTGSLQLYSFGVFVRPLSAEFGWSRTQLSGVVGLSQYALAFSAPFWGMLIDRYGPRAIVLISVIVLSAMFASLSLLTQDIWLFYLLFAAIPILAGGASPVGYSAIIVRQFDRRLGLALGLALMGVGLGATILPPIAQALVVNFGWREAYAGIGLLSLIVTVPAALVATRHTTRAVRTGVDVGVVPLSPALRTRPFLLMCLTFVLLGFVTIGVLPHLVPLLADGGMSQAEAARIAGLTGLAAVVARGGLGWLLDRTHAPYVLAALGVFAGCAFVVLGIRGGAATAVTGALMLGLVVGAEIDLISFLVRRYFKQALFGRVYGLIFGIYLLGGGTGPVVLGLSFDRTHSYLTGLLIFAALALVASAFAVAMPYYERDAERKPALAT